jgi:hypothetical protein
MVYLRTISAIQTTYIASKDGMINEYRIIKGAEGSGKYRIISGAEI